MLVLGIETSCDDTSVAIVRDGREVLSNVISNQDRFHARFAGVVPEIASRCHLEALSPAVQEALEEANVEPAQLDRIAVTTRPGLVGSLLVGLSAAKAYAWAWNKPLVAVNHMAAHLYAARFEREQAYPLLGLVISGGHTLLVRAEDPLTVEIIGSTIDDAVGEAYDKIAKHFGLGYPGGPVVDKLAATGDAAAFAFPRPLLDPETQRFRFSFSGIKTAVVHQRERFKRKDGPELVEDVCASFQAAVADVLIRKLRWLVEDTGITRVSVAGGVAANGYLRARFAAEADLDVVFPPRPLCTDNGAMVAGVAFHATEALSPRDALALDVESRIVLRGKAR